MRLILVTPSAINTAHPNATHPQESLNDERVEGTGSDGSPRIPESESGSWGSTARVFGFGSGGCVGASCGAAVMFIGATTGSE